MTGTWKPCCPPPADYDDYDDCDDYDHVDGDYDYDD